LALNDIIELNPLQKIL